MVEASYFAPNYQLTTRYLDLKAHYVTGGTADTPETL